MKLKTRVLGAAGVLALTGGFVAMAIPANAAVTPMGSCTGSVSLDKITTPVKGQGLGDQTAESVKIAGNLAKDKGTNLPIGGQCTGTYSRPGDAHVPATGGVQNPTLNPISAAVSVLGNASCANGPTAQGADATKANAWPINGKLTWKFSQTYNDLITSAPKNYTMQAAIAILGFNPSNLDEVDISGQVLTGVDAGAQVGGSIWEDPVAVGGKYRTVTDGVTTNASTTITSATAKFAPTDVGGTVVGAGIPAGDTIASVSSLTTAVLNVAATASHTNDSLTLNGDAYNTNYNLDISGALGCTDATPNNANITTVLTGGGGTSSTSALGSTGIPGLSFQAGE